jgi:oligo-1,6-glucosidase
MTVGEGAGVAYDNAPSYVSAGRQEIDMVYHFELGNRWKFHISPENFCTVQKRWLNVFEKNGWAVQYLSNHDSARQVSCYGCDSDELREPSAKLLGTLLHTTPGTPFIYQGEEIGMVNVKYDSIDDYNCCYTKGDYNSMIKSGVSPKDAIDELAPRSRDNARTPYQWDGTENAGFSSGTPWIKVNPRYKEINLEEDRKNEDSIFAFYKALIEMRKTNPAIVEGDLEFLLEDHETILCYRRRCEKQTLLIVANYSSNAVEFCIPREISQITCKRVLTNKKDTGPSLCGNRELLPWEVEIYELSK